MIRLENVRKSFGDLEVLKGISIDIQDKEIYGIIGQSGAGKSTLLRCINGLETYQGGTITVNDTLVSDKDKKQLHLLQKDMGMIFQNFNLLSRLDVYDNVALPMKFWGMKTNTPEAEKKIKDLIDLVGLGDKLHAKPRELSGGQKQRVAIAGVLAMEPDIVIFDESTSMLDPQGKASINEQIRSLHTEKEMTVVSITHDMEEVAQSEYVLVLSKGKIVMQGKPQEVFEHADQLQELRLDIPFATQVAKALKQEGIQIDESLNIEQVVNQLCQLKSNT